MEETKFRYISTYGTLPDGRVIQSHYSYPLGASVDEYRDILERNRKAYPTSSCFGTHLE